MTHDQLLAALAATPDAALHLRLPDGSFVPAHFHVTEIGRVHKDFIDCGGTTRSTTSCVVQVWVASDTEHRLRSGKLAAILQMANSLLGDTPLPVEVEYEGDVVSQYPLEEILPTPAGLLLSLQGKHTDCLAKDKCGIPTLGLASCNTPGCC